MSKNWGIPYQGSKAKIAEGLLSVLPSGKRFVDLFGGGFAMSHAAYMSGKYETVVYNELNPLLPPLIRKAIKGEYNYNVFKPVWVSREEFENKKDADGYVRYIWSFSNTGKNYLFGYEIEPIKKSIHNYIVFNRRDEWFERNFPEVDRYIKTADIRQRRLQWREYLRRVGKFSRKIDELQQLEQERLQQLERLERLQQLEQLERLQQLEITCGSYTDYKYQDGDVVYCDPPYEGTADYSLTFDHGQFYEWFMSRPYPVYLSSYNNIRDRFKMVWAENKRSLMSGASQLWNYECLYVNEGAKCYGEN